jgi:hypothetical protein
MLGSTVRDPKDSPATQAEQELVEQLLRLLAKQHQTPSEVNEEYKDVK